MSIDFLIGIHSLDKEPDSSSLNELSNDLEELKLSARQKGATINGIWKT
jgi:hypothetical protein